MEENNSIHPYYTQYLIIYLIPLTPLLKGKYKDYETSTKK